VQGARVIPGLQLLAALRGVRSAFLPTGTPQRRHHQGPAASCSTGVLLVERRTIGVGRVWLFDIQGWITLFLGGLLALITLFSSYSHVHLPFLGAVDLDQQRLF
jgi:hypothetical protein